ncbi:hypothetical protein PHLGIDRAFT_198926 [Phlebiopsis gigantea 11061_1 CR5-6]|uniref:Uncharacterized protein n=1 Tax=Phlebiopsis gigantea (strain 11061_1 CR5-6) TaxID=745531 RepID=A0A0C3S4T3_PHLG1|nr:hypothetical protein PHLGIDRAFT_198926 [Phlebiopsis gigantea 11061_1 CR5-6]
MSPSPPHSLCNYPGSRAQWRTRGVTRRLESRWPTGCNVSRSCVVMLMSGCSQLLRLSGDSSGIDPWSVPWALLGSRRSLCRIWLREVRFRSIPGWDLDHRQQR